MARRPRRSNNRTKQQRNDDGDTQSHAGSNTLSPEKVEEAVSRIETLAAELATEKSEYMLRCKDIRADVKDVYEEAKDAGITKQALKAKIKERELRKKVANCRGDLAPEQIDMFDQISQALKDIFDDTPAQAFNPPQTSPQPFSPPPAA